MALLPPSGFISAAMAAVYSIAHVLHTETNIDYRKESNSYLRDTRGIVASFIQDSGNRFSSEFYSEGITLLRHDDHWDNPFMAGGVGLSLRPKPDAPDMPKVFGPNLAVEQIDSLWLALTPPYKNCLDSERIKPKISCLGFDVDNFSPDNIDLFLPSIEVTVVSYLRQALASGRLEGFLLEETGEFTRLPDIFWRTEKAEGALMNDHPLIAQINGQSAIGYTFISIDKLRTAWESSYQEGKETKSIGIQSKTSKPSPYINFMISASKHFNLVDGQMPDGSRLLKDEIARWIDSNWPAELGEKSTTLISNMATLVRHPDAGRGGNVKAALSNLNRKSISDQSDASKTTTETDT